MSKTKKLCFHYRLFLRREEIWARSALLIRVNCAAYKFKFKFKCKLGTHLSINLDSLRREEVAHDSWYVPNRSTLNAGAAAVAAAGAVPFLAAAPSFLAAAAVAAPSSASSVPLSLLLLPCLLPP